MAILDSGRPKNRRSQNNDAMRGISDFSLSDVQSISVDIETEV